MKFKTSMISIPDGPTNLIYAPLLDECWMSFVGLTLEQQPPKIRLNIAATVSHCGIVSMNIRPARPMSLERVGR